jgi:NADH:ubiquinone oxidoreductase subunit F (NADH-binding)/NADH:ubiquinone oxidoreductase subunit E/Pyruvate/2-oxoacid:ferredoxin oxidoreductase delta subunit
MIIKFYGLILKTKDPSMKIQNDLTESIIGRYESKPSNLIMIMQDLQAEFGYLPDESLKIISERIKIPQSKIYSVATFYKSFSLKPGGKHKIDICEGTACHIRGASVLMNQVSDQLNIKSGETSEDGEFTLNTVHCVGACAMAPVVVIDGVYHGNVTSAQLSKEIKNCITSEDISTAVSVKDYFEYPPIEKKISSPQDYDRFKQAIMQKRSSEKAMVMVCAGTGCLAKGSMKVAEAFEKELESSDIAIPVMMGVKRVGCQGFCEKGPLVIIYPEKVFYTNVSPGDARLIIDETIIGKKSIDRLLFHEAGQEKGVDVYDRIPFFAGQQRLALRNVGTINPLDISDYIAHNGYSALIKALYSMKPDQVIKEIEESGLRGRGGGGFPTGKKWRSTASIDSDIRYVICNGDEGDPGAFMDRSIMEGDPHAVLEGMIICAYAVGSSKGYIYVREEYPRALQHLNTAISEARRAGFLGPNICGADFNFDITINRGTGAFVCGESTALMQSIEGKVGEPRAKYIRSAERGLYDRPTVLNNVETMVNIPLIIEQGAKWFSSTGVPQSTGTKVFSVVGKVKNTGLVEVPMGITLREIIFDLCGGILNDKKFKAVQTGGPSGGCLPASKLDLHVDFDSLTREGSMMGSGGMIVMDQETCMVDVARYFIEFLSQESCGKCSACRLGLDQLHGILERICAGEGVYEDLKRIEKLLKVLDKGSLCGLGKSASNPVRSTLKYFRDEYLAHIERKECPAGVCRNLITYEITDSCTGCKRCARLCPQQAISGDKKTVHIIDQNLCNRCGLCKVTCNFDAIVIKPRS